MRNVLLAAVLMVCTGVYVQAQQTTYEVTKLVSYNKAALDYAMSRCQLDPYRKEHSRTVLNFENGTQVSLLSFDELEALNIKADRSVALPEDATNTNTFQLHHDGYIIQQVQTSPGLLQQKLDKDKKGGE